MVCTMSMVVAFMLATAVVQGNPCPSCGESPNDDEPQNVVSLLHTKFQMGVPKVGREKGSGVNANQGRADEVEDMPIENKEPDATSDVKPRAVVHVGPHKMGSTSIQHAVFDEWDFLASDNYSVPINVAGSGRKAAAPIAACFAGGQWPGHELLATSSTVHVLGEIGPHVCTEQTMEAWKEFVSQTAANRRNLMVSSELFDIAYDTDGLASTLSAFDTTIVVSYRRLFDWIPSVHNELSGHVHNNLLNYKTLIEVLEAAADNITEYKQYPMYSTNVYDRYKRTFSDVTVLGPPGPQDQTVQLFCEVVKSPHMCAHIRQRALPRLNTHENRDHFDVASAAAKMGLLNPRACLGAVGRAFEAQHGGAGKLPRKCISKKAEESLKRLSLDAEKKLFPDTDGSELLTQFEDALKEKLCSVDTDAVLTQPKWKSFFAHLVVPTC